MTKDAKKAKTPAKKPRVKKETVKDLEPGRKSDVRGGMKRPEVPRLSFHLDC